MTAVAERPESDVVEATAADLEIAVQNALGRADLTFDELADQARTGDFESVRARLAWVAIGDLYGVVS